MRLALAILIALQVADVASTAYDLNSGFGREGNPAMAGALSLYGIQGLIAAKCVAISYATALYLWLPEPGRWLLDFAFRAASIAYVFVVFSNLRVGGLI